MTKRLFSEPLPHLFRELQTLIGLRPPSAQGFRWVDGDQMSLKVHHGVEATATRGDVTAMIRWEGDGTVSYVAFVGGKKEVAHLDVYPENDSDLVLTVDGQFVDETEHADEIHELLWSAH